MMLSGTDLIVQNKIVLQKYGIPVPADCKSAGYKYQDF